jgi:hypothetical protein
MLRGEAPANSSRSDVFVQRTRRRKVGPNERAPSFLADSFVFQAFNDGEVGAER